MVAEVIFKIASFGLIIFGSETVYNRTSLAPYQQTAFIFASPIE